MKKKRSLLRLVLLVVFFCSISCNHAYYNAAKCRELEGKIYENKCYFVPKNFKSSQCGCQEYCNEHGNGTLVCVKSKEHMTWINENFPVKREDDGDEFSTWRYIGLYKTEPTTQKDPSKFSQISMSCNNSTMYLDGFINDEPNDYAGYYEQCVVENGEGWLDVSCHDVHQCICETDSIVNPKYTDEIGSCVPAPRYGSIIQFIITICIILPIIGINYYFCTTPKSSENKDIPISSNEIEDGSQKNAIKQIVPRKIDTKALTGLRGIVALHIAISHYSGGGLGVDLLGGPSLALFYILSGYIMTIGYASKLIHPDVNQRRLAKPLDKKRFMVNRIARLFPLYWFTNLWVFPFILMIGLDGCGEFQGCISPAGNLGVTLLLQNMWWIPFNPWLPMGGKVPLPLNGVTWTIQTMFVFYIIFPYVIPYLATLRNRVKNLSLAVEQLYYLQMIIYIVLAFIGSAVLDDFQFTYWAARAYPPGRIPVFMMGCVLALRSMYGNDNDSQRLCCIKCCENDKKMMDNYDGTQQQNEEEERKKMEDAAKEADRISFRICMIYFISILIHTTLLGGNSFIFRLYLEGLMPISFAILIVHLTNAGEGKGIVNKICRSKNGQFIGRISMSLYLGHMMTFGAFHTMGVIQLFPPLILPLLLLLTGVVSYGVTIWVEDPCRKKIRGLISNNGSIHTSQSALSAALEVKVSMENTESYVENT